MKYVLVLLTLLVVGAVEAATLERLSMDDMVGKSTDVVRGRVVASNASFRGGVARRGGMIYTHYTVQILERWKGVEAAEMDVAVPGGSAQGLRQLFPGAPGLQSGSEYIFFLWTSRSGLTQIIGLSQGVMTLRADDSGKLQVERRATADPMVDASGKSVTDSGLRMTLAEFRAAMNRYGLEGRQ
jgi:hypothetical protein